MRVVGKCVEHKRVADEKLIFKFPDDRFAGFGPASPMNMAQSIASAVAAYRAAVGSPGPLFAGKISPSFNVRDDLSENPAPSAGSSVPSNPNATPLVITPISTRVSRPCSRRRISSPEVEKGPALVFPTTVSPATGSTPLRLDFETAKVVSSGKPTHDWLVISGPSGQTAGLPIQYEGGTAADRHARVIDDPTKPGNKVLEYELAQGRIPGDRAGQYKGRIQLNLDGANKTSVYKRVRMYLHPDIAHYRSYPKDTGWFMLDELWFGTPWTGDKYPFRISLHIVKEKGVGPLLLAASATVLVGPDRWQAVWFSGNKNFEVPVGQWLDLEVAYRQGDGQHGRYVVAVTPESSRVRTMVLNVTNWTYHPQSPQPVPLKLWQPLKLYTSAEIIDHVRARGGVIRVYWDDLEIAEGWNP